jgi:hypothetical protein
MITDGFGQRVKGEGHNAAEQVQLKGGKRSCCNIVGEATGAKETKEGGCDQPAGRHRYGAPLGTMSCICWNFCGLSSDMTIRELRDLVRHFKPTMPCIVETQLQKVQVEGLSRMLGYDRCFDVSSRGHSGGLIVYWNDEINLEILLFSKYHTDADACKMHP